MRVRASRIGSLCLAVLWLLQPPSTSAAVRDTAFYPSSGHPAPASGASPLLFETPLEARVQGLPVAGDPLSLGEDGTQARVTTREGVFRFDLRRGEVKKEADAASGASGTGDGSGPGAGAAPGPGGPGSSLGGSMAMGAGSAAGSLPWLRHLDPSEASGARLVGPGGTIGLLAADGTLYAREPRRGHLLWRRLASHRIARPGVSLGDYLIVAPEASRTLEAYRWSDGAPAGLFRLDSEDAYFASAPLLAAGRIVILAVEPPRAETRVLVLQPRPAVGPHPPIPALFPASR